MRVVFRLDDENNTEIVFKAEYVTHGQDGRDIYVVNYSHINDHMNEDTTLVARLYDKNGIGNRWYVTDAHTLRFNEIPVKQWYILPDDKKGYAVEAYGSTDFEVGWSRGYDAGYAQGEVSKDIGSNDKGPSKYSKELLKHFGTNGSSRVIKSEDFIVTYGEESEESFEV